MSFSHGAPQLASSQRPSGPTGREQAGSQAPAWRPGVFRVGLSGLSKNAKSALAGSLGPILPVWGWSVGGGLLEES